VHDGLFVQVALAPLFALSASFGALSFGALSCGGAGDRPSSSVPSVLVPMPSSVSAGNVGGAPTEFDKAHVEPAAPISWERDERSARQRARRAELPLLVFLHAEWSASSNEVDRTVWASAEVAQHMRGFVAVRVDLTETGGDAELIAERYGVNAVPSVVIENVDGDRVAQLGGVFEAAELLAAMEKAYD